MTNNFRVFAETKQSGSTRTVETDAEWTDNSNATRKDGSVPGTTVESQPNNTALRQATLLSTALVNALDELAGGTNNTYSPNDTLADFALKLKNIIKTFTKDYTDNQLVTAKNALEAQINTEKTNREAADTTEKNARIAADNTLQTNINTVSGNLTTEITTRQNQYNTLNGKLDDKMDEAELVWTGHVHPAGPSPSYEDIQIDSTYIAYDMLLIGYNGGGGSGTQQYIMVKPDGSDISLLHGDSGSVWTRKVTLHVNEGYIRVWRGYDKTGGASGYIAITEIRAIEDISW